MKKILIIQLQSLNPNTGGVQKVSYNLGQYFTSRSFNVEYFTFIKNDDYHLDFAKIHFANNDSGVSNSKNLNQLKDLLINNDFDFLINQAPYEEKLTNLIGRLSLTTKKITCIHNSLFSYKLNIRRQSIGQPFPANLLGKTKLGVKILESIHFIKHRIVLKKIIKAHDQLVLFTKGNHDELSHFVGNSYDNKVSIIPNPVKYDNYKSKNKEKIILHVGRINSSQKRSDLLLKFWDRCYKHLKDWRFIVIGDGPYLNELRIELSQKNLPRVELLGHQDPVEYYKIASIFMMPSAYEGFPNTILEAQYFGCPVIAFDSYPALKSIVNNNKDALLIQPFSIEEFSKKTIRLIESGNLKIYQQNTKHNIKKYYIDNVGSKWIELFDRLTI